jgi:hypothetical protein
MAGTITVQSGSSLPVSDFRITEVLYRAGSGGADLIEITNMGPAAGDLGRYRIAISGSNASIPLASVVVPSAGQVTIQPASSGSNTATHIFLPSLTALPDVMGSVALYAPNTVGGQTSLSNATQIIDFVQYGATGQDNEATAIAAGLWTALDFAPSVGTEGHSIEFCGNRSSRGGDQWSEVSTPNFGSDGNCITPARQSTWGRIKSLYR